MERNDHQMEQTREAQKIPAALQGQAPASQERPMRREQAQVGAESISQTLRVIDVIERTLSDAYRVPLKKNMCVVDASEMADLIGQLRIALPKSVSQAQSVLTSSQRIIAEAKMRADKDADSIYSQACVHVDKMLSGAAAALSRSASDLAGLRDSLLGQGQQPGSGNPM